MRRAWIMTLAGCIGLVLVCERADAVPAFQRRYQVQCSVCHAGFPKLNNVGQGFKQRGFRMKGETKFDKNAWLKDLPVSGRASFSHEYVENADSLSQFIVRIDSAGNLGRRLSYWVDEGVRFWSSDDRPVRDTKPNDAYLRYEMSRAERLYVRAGRMEMDLPFTQARNPHLFAYDIYDAFGPDSLGRSKDGIELGGKIKRDARWSMGVFAGSASGTSKDVSFFLRTAMPYRLHRFGLFGYMGANAPGDVDFQRIGLDWDLWFGNLNVYGLYGYGMYGAERAVQGAMAQGDYQIEDRVVIGARLSYVRGPKAVPTAEGAPPPASQNETRFGFYPGVQVWVAPRFRVAFEYGFFNHGQQGRGRLQADLVF